MKPRGRRPFSFGHADVEANFMGDETGFVGSADCVRHGGFSHSSFHSGFDATARKIRPKPRTRPFP